MELDELRSRPATDHSTQDAARFKELTDRSEKLSKGHADRVASSEVLGEKAA